MTDVPILHPLGDPDEIAVHQYRRKIRLRRLIVVVVWLAVVLGYVGWKVGTHLVASQWLEAHRFQVIWSFGQEDRLYGGATSVRASALPFFFDRNTNAVLKYLDCLHRLETLDLKNAFTLRDEDMTVLDRLPWLRQLELDRSMDLRTGYDFGRLTDATMIRIGRLSHLEDLSLGGQRITDEGLVNLVGLDQLRTLNLENTGISDAAFEHLSRLAHLKKLDVSGTQMTPKGVADFEKNHPGVEVVVNRIRPNR